MTDNSAPPPPGTADIADRREEFDRLSRRGREESNTAEFIEHKIEIVRSDPHLTDEEKAAAIAELRRLMG